MLLLNSKETTLPLSFLSSLYNTQYRKKPNAFAFGFLRLWKPRLKLYNLFIIRLQSVHDFSPQTCYAVFAIEKRTVIPPFSLSFLFIRFSMKNAGPILCPAFFVLCPSPTGFTIYSSMVSNPSTTFFLKHGILFLQSGSHSQHLFFLSLFLVSLFKSKEGRGPEAPGLPFVFRPLYGIYNLFIYRLQSVHDFLSRLWYHYNQEATNSISFFLSLFSLSILQQRKSPGAGCVRTFSLLGRFSNGRKPPGGC